MKYVVKAVVVYIKKNKNKKGKIRNTCDHKRRYTACPKKFVTNKNFFIINIFFKYKAFILYKSLCVT